MTYKVYYYSKNLNSGAKLGAYSEKRKIKSEKWRETVLSEKLKVKNEKWARSEAFKLKM